MHHTEEPPDKKGGPPIASADGKPKPELTGKPGTDQTWDKVTTGWLGITDKYWATALIPDQATPYTAGTESVFAWPIVTAPVSRSKQMRHDHFMAGRNKRAIGARQTSSTLVWC